MGIPMSNGNGNSIHLMGLEPRCQLRVDANLRVGIGQRIDDFLRHLRRRRAV